MQTEKDFLQEIHEDLMCKRDIYLKVEKRLYELEQLKKEKTNKMIN